MLTFHESLHGITVNNCYANRGVYPPITKALSLGQLVGRVSSRLRLRSGAKPRSAVDRDCMVHSEKEKTNLMAIIILSIIYTVGHKKGATFIFTITLANVDRF